MPARAGRSLEVPALLAIVALATVLRFDGLGRRGFIYWDEGKFALEGIRLLTLGHNLLGAHDPVTLGKAVGTAKPDHALLIALAYLLLGVHDYTPLYLDALASVAAVLVAYGVARALFDRWVALAASFLLAVSEYDAIYARSALSESDATLLLLIGVWTWLRGRQRSAGPTDIPYLAASGVVFGVAFTVNYRMVVYIAVLVGIDCLVEARHGSRRGVAVRLGLWATSLAVAPLLWQGIDLFASAHGVILFRNEVERRPALYLAQVAYQLHQGKQSVVRFEPLPYLQWFTVRQGAVSLSLLIAGLVVAPFRRLSPWLFVAAFIVFPYVVYLTAPFVVPRNLNAAMPFVAILIGALLSLFRGLPRRPRLGAFLFALAALLVGASNLLLAWRLTPVRSGLTRGAVYVERHGGGRAIIANEVMVFYFRDGAGPCLAPRMPYTVKQLGADIQYGFRYAVLDQPSGSSTDQYINRRLAPVAAFSSLGPVSLGENLIDSENSLTPDKPPAARTVRIYDLARLPLRRQAHPRRPGCTREAPP